MSKKITLIPVDDIKISEIAIRGVDKKDEDFQGLKTDIEQRFNRGLEDYVQQPILVRQVPDPTDETGKEKITVLVDGLQRLTACKEAGIDKIPAINRGEMSDMDALINQFTLNKHRVKQKPASEGQQFNRMLSENNNLTVGGLAALVGASQDFILKRMRIADKLAKPIQELVDTGEINLQNAKALCELPQDEQGNYVDDALTMPSNEFVPMIHARATEIKQAIRAGKAPKKTEFSAAPRSRKQAEIMKELETKKEASNRFKDPKQQEAFLTGLAWAIEMDNETIEFKKEKWEAQQAEKERRRKERAKERQEKAAKAAQEKAAAIQNELETP